MVKTCSDIHLDYSNEAECNEINSIIVGFKLGYENVNNTLRRCICFVICNVSPCTHGSKSSVYFNIIIMHLILIIVIVISCLYFVSIINKTVNIYYKRLIIKGLYVSDHQIFTMFSPWSLSLDDLRHDICLKISNVPVYPLSLFYSKTVSLPVLKHL